MKRSLMKKMALSFLFVSAFLGFAQTAHALTFTDVFTYDDDVTYGTFQSSGFSWLHDITDNIGGNVLSDITFLNATLTISHDNTGASELWNVTGLGNLDSNNSPDSSVFTFDLTSLTDLQIDGLFTAFLTESTTGADGFRFFTATLTGNYNVNGGNNLPTLLGNPNPGAQAVPEPFSGLLVMAGLGMAGLTRKRAR